VRRTSTCARSMSAHCTWTHRRTSTAHAPRPASYERTSSIDRAEWEEIANAACVPHVKPPRAYVWPTLV
ncbi:uncharacterized protein TRAVEDRAFT_32519, partial [Trametes versicolor FP-101664 SS1]